MKYLKNYNESIIHNILLGAFLSLGLISISNNKKDIANNIITQYEKDEPIKDTVIFINNKIQLNKKYNLEYINNLFNSEYGENIYPTLNNISRNNISPISFSLFIVSEDEGIKNLPILELNYNIGKDLEIMFYNTGVIKDNIYGIGVRKKF